MRYLHTMIRVSDLDESLDFWVGKVGLVETRRKEVPEGKFTLVFLAAPKDEGRAQTENAPELELTYNWDSDESSKPAGAGAIWPTRSTISTPTARS